MICFNHLDEVTDCIVWKIWWRASVWLWQKESVPVIRYWALARVAPASSTSAWLNLNLSRLVESHGIEWATSELNYYIELISLSHGYDIIFNYLRIFIIYYLLLFDIDWSITVRKNTSIGGVILLPDRRSLADLRNRRVRMQPSSNASRRIARISSHLRPPASQVPVRHRS